MKYNKKQRSNLNQVALNRFDNDVPKEIWLTEGKDFVSLKRNLSPYDIDLYKAIEYAIQEGVISINDSSQVSLNLSLVINENDLTIANNLGDDLVIPLATALRDGWMSKEDKEKLDSLSVVDGSETDLVSGTHINITGSGTQADPYVINNVKPDLTDAEVKTKYENNLDTNAFTNAEKLKLAQLTPIVNEDDMASSSTTSAPSQQSVVNYVTNSLVEDKFTYQIISNRIKVLAKPSSVTYSNNLGINTSTLTIDSFGDISHASIPVTQGVDYQNGSDFKLEIVFSDNSVNTWAPVTNDVNSVNNQNIYIPDITYHGYNLPFFTGVQSLTTHSFTPDITWTNGKLILTYTDASPFGGNDRLIFNINFNKK